MVIVILHRDTYKLWILLKVTVTVIVEIGQQIPTDLIDLGHILLVSYSKDNL
jgi:hypothetical protein